MSWAIKKFLKLCDIYGTQISFHYEKSLLMKSVTGGICSILTAILGVIVLYYFSNDCIKKKNPGVREANVYKEQNSIDANNFYLGLHFTDSQYLKLENPEKYLAFHAVISDLRISNTPNYEILQFSKCKLNKHFLKNSDSELNNIQSRVPYLNESYCLDLPQNFTFLNSDSEVPRKSINIYVTECANMTIQRVSCK